MKTNKSINVLWDDCLVGVLAMTPDRSVAFQYSDQWIERGISISPFSLPVSSKVYVPEKTYFDGLFGIFADSLPDAWGRLLLNRLLQQKGKNPDSYTVLDRLAIVGNSGMGKLVYEPQIEITQEKRMDDLDELAGQCQKILNTEYSDKLDELYQLGGTSGGARPKIMTEYQGKDWIIKFPAHVDGKNIGRQEYEYSLCARECGITMSETKLFPSENCDGYFGIQRFDREKVDGKIKRVHVATAAALLELDYEQPSLDYHSLMKLTQLLTADDHEQREQMYRRMCFNVFAHNRDDHSKNFSFLYDEGSDRWKLSPAYDLTYSTTHFGEHTTTVDGNGKDPGFKELVRVGVQAGMSKDSCEEIAQNVQKCVQQMLGEYNPLEEEYKITRTILEQLVNSDCYLSISTKSKLILRDIDLLKQVKNLSVSMSINTLNEDFRKDMDNASTIKERLNTLKELHNNGIHTVLFMSPIFPYITEWEKIIEESKDYIDEYWFENLNLRGSYKTYILNYIKEKYPNYYDKYIDIYLKNNQDYWLNLANEINSYCNKNYINYINYFYHDELVKAKKENQNV